MNDIHLSSIVETHVRLGVNNIIRPFCWIGAPPQVTRDAIVGGCTIGADNEFRENVSIHSGCAPNSTIIGDSNFLLAHAHIGHDVEIGSYCLLGHSASIGGHTWLGNYVNIGAGSFIAPFKSVGSFSYVSPGSLVDKNILPFCIAQGDRQKVRGLNIIGMKKNNFTGRQIQELNSIMHGIQFNILATNIEKVLQKCRHIDERIAIEFESYLEAINRLSQNKNTR